MGLDVVDDEKAEKIDAQKEEDREVVKIIAKGNPQKPVVVRVEGKRRYS